VRPGGAVLGQRLLPVLCGAALRSIGIEPVLDAIVDWLPSPLDVPPVRGRDPKTGATLERPADPAAPVCALAFKVHAEAHGDLHFLRVYSGILKAGAHLTNPRTGRHERPGRLLRIHADQRTQVDAAGPGEILAVTGLKHVTTGDTLCDEHACIVLETLVAPEPVLSMVLEPRSTLDRDKLRLRSSGSRGPLSTRRRTSQRPVAGQRDGGHTSVLLLRRQEHHVEASMGRPRVSRETPRRERAPAWPRARQAGAQQAQRVQGGRLEHRRAGRRKWRTDRVGAEVVVPLALRPAVAQALATRQWARRFPDGRGALLITGGPGPGGQRAGFVRAAAIALREASQTAEIDLLRAR
jgi:elongation factor G